MENENENENEWPLLKGSVHSLLQYLTCDWSHHLHLYTRPFPGRLNTKRELKPSSHQSCRLSAQCSVQGREKPDRERTGERKAERDVTFDSDVIV